jgi:MOSC domain-containing protein YiiM
MKVLSVNVGLPRLVEHHGEPVATGIFKESVKGRVRVNEFNLDGDAQADLRVHGGYYKAVYVYPVEHYEFWRRELPEINFSYGMFGENLTSKGLLETDVNVGDRIRIGTSEFVVTQPREPCFKLSIRFNRTDIIKRFAKSGRSGFYLAIEKTGELGANDEIEFISRAINQPSIFEITRQRFNLKDNFQQ